MCDTMVALADYTSERAVIFAKNSDREPNEAHELLTIPRTVHSPGASVHCTYLEIPQARETNAVFLCKPAWIWGAEMGANEHGVVIGNEAVFTKVKQEKAPSLTGMDLLRLALERAGSARAALDTITSLLQQYGQGGNCGYTHPFYYHNSYLIADPGEAWVLETAGRHWAAERVKGIRTISNALTIGNEWDLASPDLENYAFQRGWCKRREDFHFARCYSDVLYTHLSDANARQCRSTELLNSPAANAVQVRNVFGFLRDHGPQVAPNSPLRPSLTGADICMHAGFGPVRNSQSTGSMVSQLLPGRQIHWVTGTSAPCTGVFKPVWMDAGLPDLGPRPGNAYDEASLWWRHETLHRSVLKDYPARLALYCQERDDLEATYIADVKQLQTQPASERLAFSTRCFATANEATLEWIDRVSSSPPSSRQAFLNRMAWTRFNRQAGMADLLGDLGGG